MPKSILKQTSTRQGPLHFPARQARHRETALFHANLIQQQKEIESQIFSATETLLDFPSSPKSSAVHPAQEDINVAKALLKPFQPADLDALVQERNIDKKCGYIFCSNPHRKQDTNARCRILQSKGEGKKTLKFVDRHLLERWCSDECGKRAMFIRVQLSDEPAWTRADDAGGDIMFLEDEFSSANNVNDALAQRLQRLNVADEVEDMEAALKQLAIERGSGHADSKGSVLVDVNIFENRVLQDPMSVEHEKDFTELHDSIEGYMPRFPKEKTIDLT